MRCPVFLGLLIGIAGCTNSPYVETRSHVSYYASDWAHTDMHGSVDTPPQPEGGMKAFTARLDYPGGRVVSTKVLQSVNPELDAIVLRAVQETGWKPATRGGKAVPFKFKFPVTFRV